MYEDEGIIGETGEEFGQSPASHQPIIHDLSDAAPILCKEQQDLLDLIATGRNVFFTGSAGCGKSTVLKAAVRMLQRQGKVVQIVAPTGRAALQVNGMSTWSYMGWTPDFHKLPIDRLIAKGFRKYIRHRLKETDVLVIDEISMVENQHLERMNICMKAVITWKDWQSERGAFAFGGKQVIVTGDFCQLPPVKPFEFCMHCGQEMIADDDAAEFNCPENHGPFLETHKWAFKSAAWEEANFVHVELKEIHRQKDEYFIRMLQKCRLGLPFLPQEVAVLMEHPCNVRNAAKLLCTREKVARVNNENFRKLKTPMYKYNALDGFDSKNKMHSYLPQYQERLDDGTLAACRDHRLEAQTILRGGMLVILQVNLDLKGGLVNGSQGIICGFEAFDPKKLPKVPDNAKEAKSLPQHQLISGEHARLRARQIKQFMEQQPAGLQGWPRVLFHNGQKRVIYASCIVNSIGDEEPYSLLHRTQIPLIAGWAMTVHRSQGMTLDRVIVDLSSAFEEGQVYVALSRATSLNGLKIVGSSSELFTTSTNYDVQMFLQAKFNNTRWLDFQ